MIAKTIYEGIFIEITINERIILQESTESNLLKKLLCKSNILLVTYYFREK